MKTFETLSELLGYVRDLTADNYLHDLDEASVGSLRGMKAQDGIGQAELVELADFLMGLSRDELTELDEFITYAARLSSRDLVFLARVMQHLVCDAASTEMKRR